MDTSLVKKHTPEETYKFPSIVMTLSLFILLLAFFVMLNASSHFVPERVAPAMKSIEETFTPRVFRDDRGPSLTAEPEKRAGDGYDAYQSLDSYFKTSFPGMTQRMLSSEGIFYLEVDADQFEKKLFNDQSSLRKILIEKLWAFDQLQMEIWLNTDINPAEAGFAAPPMIKKLSAWAAALEKQGLEKGRLTIGLQKGNTKKVIVLFRNYKPYTPEP